MSKKVLNLLLDVQLSGDKSLKKVNQELKDTDVAVGNLSHSMQKSGSTITKQTLAVEVYGRTLKDLEIARRKLTSAFDVPLKNVKSTVTTGGKGSDKTQRGLIPPIDYTKLRAEARRYSKFLVILNKTTQATIQKDLASSVTRRISLIALERREVEKLIRAKNFTKSGTGSGSSNRKAQVDNKDRLINQANKVGVLAKLNALRQEEASRRRILAVQQRQFNQLVRLDRQAKTAALDSVKRTVSESTKLRNQQVTSRRSAEKDYTRWWASELKKREAAERDKAKRMASLRARAQSFGRAIPSQLDQVNTSLNSVIRSQRNWTTSIAQGIGLYRTVSFLLHSITQSIAAIPRIGIEKQTTEAVFASTLGSAGSSAAFEVLDAEAERAGISVGVLRENFRNLHASMSLAGETTKTTFKVFQDLNTVSTALHLSGPKVQLVFAAIAQIFNKSKVQSEELVKQLGNLLPGAFASFQQANRSAFKSTEELAKAMQLGMVRAHNTMANFTDFLADRFGVAFAVASTGLQANIGRLQTSFIRLGEAIFDKTEGAMLAVVTSFTAFNNSIADVIAGTSALSVIFNGVLAIALGAVVIAGFKFFTLLRGLTVLIPKATGVGTILTKVPLHSWAHKGAIAVAVLTAAITKLGKANVIILGLTAIGFAISRIGKQSRDAAEKVEELRLEKERLAKQNAIGSVSLKISVEGTKEVIAARERVETLRAAFQRTVNVSKSLEGVPLLENLVNKKDSAKALAVLREAQDQLKALILSTSIDIRSKREEELERESKVEQDGILKDVAAAKEKQVLINSIEKEAIQQRLIQVNQEFKDKTISFTDYISKKRALQLKEIEQDRVILQQQRNLLKEGDGNSATARELELKFARLKTRRAQILADLANEKPPKRSRGAAGEENLKEQARKTFIEQIREINKEHLTLIGNVKELDKLKRASRDADLKESSKASGIAIPQNIKDITKLIDKVKDLQTARKVVVDKLSNLETNLAITRLTNQSKVLEGNLAQAHTTKSTLGLVSDIADARRESLALVKEELSITPDNIDLLKTKLDIERQIAEERAKANQDLKDVSNKGFDKALNIVGGSKIRNIETTGLIQDLTTAEESRNVLLAEANANYRDSLSGGAESGFERLETDVNTIQSSGLSNIEQTKLQDQAMMDYKAGLQAQELASFQAHQDKITGIESRGNTARLNAFGGYALGVADMSTDIASAQVGAAIKAYGAESEQAKKAFAIYKGTMMAKIAIATALSVMNIWSTWGELPVVAGVLSAAVVALGAVQLAQVAAQQVPSAHGGLTNVPDEQTYLLNKGERVLSPNQNADFTRFIRENNNQQQGTGVTQGGNAPANNVTIVNSVDQEIFNDYLGTYDGEQRIMNIVRKNEAA